MKIVILSECVVQGNPTSIRQIVDVSKDDRNLLLSQNQAADYIEPALEENHEKKKRNGTSTRSRNNSSI